MQSKAKEISIWNSQVMGSSLLIDFQSIPESILVSAESLKEIFLKCMQDAYPNQTIQESIYGENRVLLSSSEGARLIVEAFKEQKTIAIDFYHPSQDKHEARNKANMIEAAISDRLGWNSQTFALPITRGDSCKLICNESENKSEILYNAKLIYREMTPFQELRVYDTKAMGRILLLDDMVQITQDLVDNYTVDMVNGVIQADKKYKEILIIGGGDMLIAGYILTKFSQNVDRITVCEIDERVIEVVKQFFDTSSIISDSLKSGKLQIVCQDGSVYAQKLQKENQLVDGIIIDCTDFLPEGGVANSLFTQEFYKDLYTVMRVGAMFSQQLSYQDMVEITKVKWESVGFKTNSVIMCHTPEYSEDLPIAYVIKQ